MLEVLIAAVILALIIAAIGSTFVIGKKHVMHSIARMTAGELARYHLDNLSTQVREDQWDSNCLGNNIGCTSNSYITFDNLIHYNETFTITNSSVGEYLRKTSVNITWYEITPQ